MKDEPQEQRPRRGVIGRVWSCRWALARMAAAVMLLLVFVKDNPARMARVQLAALPGFDYVGEVRELRGQGRFGEALAVAEAGLDDLTGEAHATLLHEKAATEKLRDSAWRKAKQFVKGAALGQGTSIEELVGAVSADMLVVGDVRDILIQGSRLAVDRETDEFILALSAVGIATTVAPEIDWAASLMKVAKKAGAMTKGMSDAVLAMARRAMRSGDNAELLKFSDDVLAISKRASPAGAIRLLRFVDDPKDVERVADFMKREKAGAFALHATGKEGVDHLKRAGQAGEAALVAAAKRGPRGIAWLRSGNGRLLRPHPILGLIKVSYKGTGPALIELAVKQYLDPFGLVTIGVLGTWLVVEGMVVWRRLTRG